MKKIEQKDLGSIAYEWDEISEQRERIIEAGLDFSLQYVNLPCIMNQVIQHCNLKSIIDVGCGTGQLSAQLSKNAVSVIGIDVSKKSIEIASKHYFDHNNVKFLCSSIQDFNSNIQFTTCTANMVFMTDPNYLEDIQVIHELLSDKGMLVFSITHPCFWPSYWGYQAEPWFRYDKECYIENNFSTSLSNTIGISTHIHRPLSYYINGLIGASFDICEIVEPYPISPPPPGYHYDLPRFLHVRAIKK